MPVLTLEQRIPEHGFRHPDDVLEAFLSWVSDQGIALYPHQEEAILELYSGHSVVLDAPTGSGKSLVATAMHFKTFAGLGRAWYTAPIKALVSEKFFELCRTFGAANVGMITGDGAVNRGAPIICCTAEILANVALGDGEDADVTSVVMDEFHYYADRDRGMAWQLPLLTLPRATFLLMSATLGDTRVIREDLAARTGRPVVEVYGAHRPVPLEYAYSQRPFTEALSTLVREGKAPVYVVHFTQNDATEQAQALMSVDYCTKEEKKAIAAALHGFRFHSPFGATMRRYVMHGVGLHHAGLLPRYRLLVERLAQQGLLKIICGTDTLGVGINVPIRTVLFTQLCKFDGEKVGILKVREFKQIAGRAGRAGYDTVGYVVAQAPAHVIENLVTDIRVTDPKKRRKIVKAQPPTKGYKHWDEETFKQLCERPPETLESKFSVDHGRLLALMQHAQDAHGDARRGYDTLIGLIDRSHASANEKEKLRTAAAGLLENLRQAHVVGEDRGVLVLDPTLQHDFSLHHSLSLFLLDALSTLDPKSPTHTTDTLTWVEAILENPRPVLMRQQDRERFQALQALKAAGVPYEERITALEEISWPKPGADAIYEYFNSYKERHPWLAAEAIRPKSVVGEMAALYTSFSDYVKDLGLQRSEGVLLRYVTDVYKALVQNVPVDSHDDTMLDLLAYLRAMLATVDASLLTEWETLLSGGDAPATSVSKVDISADRRVFVARVRAELHGLVKALSRQDWEEAAALIRRSEEEPWAPADFERALAPFIEEHGGVQFDHRARGATFTTVRPSGPHQWLVRQVLPTPARERTLAEEFEQEDDLDPGAWSIEARVDLRGDTNPDGPIIEVLAVGP